MPPSASSREICLFLALENAGEENGPGGGRIVGHGSVQVYGNTAGLLPRAGYRNTHEVDRWKNLYQHYSQVESARRELERATQEADKARREFDEWCEQATHRVMEDLAKLASSRATEFQEAAGGEVRVEYPSHPPIGLGEDGPFMTFMKIGLASGGQAPPKGGENEVHIYSHRRPGALPAFHLVYTASPTDAEKSKGKRARSLVSQPGCFVVREDSGYGLRAAEVGSNGTLVSGSEMHLDELVFRAFEVLVNEATRRA